MVTSRQVHLNSHPAGKITPDNFELVSVDLPDLRDGEFLVKNLWMGVEAGMRSLLDEPKLQIRGLPIKMLTVGDVLPGQAVGRVIESKDPKMPVDSIVLTYDGWKEYGLNTRRSIIDVIDPAHGPVQAHLGVLGLYGLSAYYLLTEAAKIALGETVVITSAAGAVGSAACLFAKRASCRVIGLAGSEEKVAWLKNELGIDGAINYKTSNDLESDIADLCPAGVNVFVDSVGGAQLEAGLAVMNVRGRVIKIGETGNYDGGAPTGPGNMFLIALKRLQIIGFSGYDHWHRAGRAQFHQRVSSWIAKDLSRMRETTYDGIENAVAAQIAILEGSNIGKMLVKLAD